MQKDNEDKIEKQLSSRSKRFDGANTFLGMMLALLSTISFSFMSLFVSLMSGSVPSFEIAFFRFLAQGVGALLSIAFARSDKHELRTWLGKRENWIKLFRRGAWGIGGLTSWFYSLQHLALSDATCIFFAQVPITSLLATFVLKEPYTKADFFAAISCIVGMLLVIQPAFLFGGDENHTIDVFALCVCLFGACCASMVYISIRQIGSREDPLVIVLWFSLMGMLVTPILASTLQYLVLPTRARDIGLLVGMGIVGYIGQIALNRGLQVAPAGQASLMRYGDIVLAIIFQSFILKEAPPPLKIVGAVLIISTVFAALYKMRMKAKAEKLAKAREPAPEETDASSGWGDSEASLQEVTVASGAPVKQTTKYMKFDDDEGNGRERDGVSSAPATSNVALEMPIRGVAPSLSQPPGQPPLSIAGGNAQQDGKGIVVALAQHPTIDDW